MSKFGVSDTKEASLRKQMAVLGIKEEDLVERFVRGSGPGGQKINKTSSCVYLLHKPSGIEIKCQKERSQALNRFWARRELCNRIETRLLGQKSKKAREAYKIKKQKQRRSRRSKTKLVADKRLRGDVKKGRGFVKQSDD